MLVSMKDILQHAHKHNYAVMAVNSINMEMARAVISAAEEEHSPIIVHWKCSSVSVLPAFGICSKKRKKMHHVSCSLMK